MFDKQILLLNETYPGLVAIAYFIITAYNSSQIKEHPIL